MELAVAGQTLKPRAQAWGGQGRLLAALVLWAALAGCSKAPLPVIEGSWRIGLGALALDLDPSAERLAVACRRSNDVWVLNAEDGSMLARIDTLPSPRSVLFHPDGASYFVPEGLSSVAQIRLRDLRVARRFRPRAKVGVLAFEPRSRRLFAGHEGLPTLGVYRLKDMHLETAVAVGGQVRAIQVLGSKAWVLSSQADALAQVSLADLSVRAAAATGPEPRAMALDEGRDRAWVACRGREGESAPLAVPSPEARSRELSSISSLAQAGSEELDGADALSPGAGTDPGPEAVPGVVDEDDEPLALDVSALRRFDGGGIAVVRLSDVRRVDYIPVPGGPVAVVPGPAGRQLAVACEDGNLRMVDLQARAVVSTLKLNGRPGAMRSALSRSRLWLALSDEKALLTVRPGEGW